MAKLAGMCDGSRPYPGKRPREFFSTNLNPLILSAGCRRLEENPAHRWLFQLIQLYQGKSGLKSIAQRWHFTKSFQEIGVVCEDPHGQVLCFLGIDLLDFHQDFYSVSLYVAQGKCMLKNEDFFVWEVS